MSSSSLIGPRYELSELEAAFISTTVVSPSADILPFSGPQPAITIRRSSLNDAAQANMPAKRGYLFAAIAKECEQVKKSLAEQGAHDEYPLWYLGHMSLAHFCSDGYDHAHEISRAHPKYTPAGVDAALQQVAAEQAKKGTGAPTCAHFQSCRPAVCQSCPHSGKVTTPYSLGVQDHQSASQAGNLITAVITGAPLTRMPRIMDETTARVELDERYSLVSNWGNVPSFIRHNEDGSIARRRPRELQVELAGYYVEIIEKDKTRQIPASTWWVNDARKRVFDAVIYDPENKLARPGETVFNLWRGFAIEAVRGDWRKMRRHIWRVLCGKDAPSYKYLIRWLADLVQHPGRSPEVMVVLRSLFEGVGKSTLGQWILRMLGSHGVELTDSRHAFGQFNEILVAKSFALLEEGVFPGDHQGAAQTKAVLTAKTLTINPKGVPAYQIPNTLHFMMTTNSNWSVPAGAGARRYLVLDVKEKMDRKYFDQLWSEAENGGIAAMLYDLLRVDLSRFNVRDVPTTAGLIDQQRRSADDICQWVTDGVITGVIVPGAPNGGFGTPLSPSHLHQCYLDWCLRQGIRRPKVALVVCRALGEMGATRNKSNSDPKWTLPDAATLLAASDRRAGIKSRGRR